MDMDLIFCKLNIGATLLDFKKFVQVARQISSKKDSFSINAKLAFVENSVKEMKKVILDPKMNSWFYVAVGFVKKRP